ncbi:hypothetical protein FSP39_004105 [Pinctada imbricata]|uniref:Hemicentin-1-like von Willebrand factor A domain-containing protein n=1 Tax=Pinctada imbricata TaxID=66713 RepID=A0AA88YAG8_PINIB|nr:hypothetical protein FSP39_004105 [Pinctada imbricata]
MDICFSFDTTGSMSSSIGEVKGKVQDMIQRLQADIPGINIAVFAHGDYCDRSNYITTHIDFSTNVKALCQWIKKVKSTSGGDSDECYELVLHEVQELSWRPGSQRALVMIGDALPHEPSYPDNKLKLDWRKRQTSLQKWYKFVYEKEVRARNKGKAIKNDLDKMFGTLRKEASTASTSSIVAPTLTKKASLKKVPSLPTSTKKAAVVKPTPKVAKPLKKKIISKTKATKAKTAKVDLISF